MKKLMFAVCAAFVAAGAWAKDAPVCEFDSNPNWTPFALSLFLGLDLPPSDYSVTGLRLGIFAGRHEDVLFFSVSSIADLVTDNVNGLQVAGCCNHAGRSTGAFQTAGFVNSIGADFTGLQVAGLYNAVHGTLAGASIAPLTNSKATDGLQIGFFNKTKTLNGVQIGAINLTEESDGGIQIGAFNIMKDAKYPVMPIMNAGF